MLSCQIIARAPRFSLQVWNNLIDFLHFLNLDMILPWRFAAVSVLIEGASVADDRTSHGRRRLLNVGSAMLCKYLRVVSASLARRLQYHLLSSFIFPFLGVVDLLRLLLLGRHLLALLIA